MNEPLSKVYDPSTVETKLYALWEAANAFGVRAEAKKEAFTIVIPPPNVTGALHMGHALDNTLQDVLIRYKRMDGHPTLWIPGMDHAGIATQNVVERELAKDGQNRKDLGREAFVAKVWEWKENYGGKILHQLKRLGASCDWSRQRFTMDEGLSAAVREVFVKLYEEKLIYRSSYLVSWCSRCQTAISDLEVEHRDVNGALTHFSYAVAGGKTITVATTRPETMLGDTAVAVHPDDARYAALVGKTITHPFTGATFPVIADAQVDPKFGSGAVKITPAHDPNDYEMGQRHGLPMPTILDEAGKIDLPGSKYHGVDRFLARKQIVADLEAAGLFVKAEPHAHSVGHCQRCGTVVEPRISLQWFVRIAPLAAPAIEAVKSGRTKFVPENWQTTYLHWMENIRDWCISRQLWWGHRIPVWYCEDGHMTVARVDPTKCGDCGKTALTQDADVLDTWFSSALWPFSTLGWPNATPELAKHYPTSVLVTGFDIIFFWVARMMMMGLHFMKDVPFRQVHIHALVLDEHGKKMTKSRGNVVNPLDLMDRYGTDALRFTLAVMAVQGRDLPLSEKRVEGYRNFVSKLWNAARFLQMSLENAPATDPTPSLADRWIESRLHDTVANVRAGIEAMKFNEAADAIYRFVWNEYCDWYLEMQKVTPHPKFALKIFGAILKTLHPICPFVTEELWQSLPFAREKGFLMLEDYPVAGAFQKRPEAEAEFEMLQKAVEAIRHFRSENKVAPSKKIKDAQYRLIPGEDTDQSAHKHEVLRRNEAYLRNLAGIDTVHGQDKPNLAGKCTWVSISNHLSLSVSWEGLIDQAAETDRIKKLLEQAQKDIQFLNDRAAKYNEKTPPQLRAKDADKLQAAKLLVEKYERELSALQA